MARTRGTSNGNSSGNSYDRRARRARMWRRFASDGRIKCWYCSRRMTKDEFQVDRLVCGHDGGRYVDQNIVPACDECNRNKCARICKRGVTAVDWKASQIQLESLDRCCGIYAVLLSNNNNLIKCPKCKRLWGCVNDHWVLVEPRNSKENQS
jgi:hypothetical protein